MEGGIFVPPQTKNDTDTRPRKHTMTLKMCFFRPSLAVFYRNPVRSIPFYYFLKKMIRAHRGSLNWQVHASKKQMLKSMVQP